MKHMTVFLMIRVVMLTIIVHAVALIGPALMMRAAMGWLSSASIWSAILGSFVIAADVVVLFLSCILVTGMTSWLLRLRYAGTHELSARVPAVRHWLFHMAVYLPTAVVLDFLHLYPLKTLHAKLFGARIGSNVVLAGLLLDPCLCEIGEGSHTGGFSVIFGHSAEANQQRITFAPVQIGKRCAVGARAVIMPGARMEDGSRLGPQSLLLQTGTLASDSLYLGSPARKIPPSMPREKIPSNAEVCARA